VPESVVPYAYFCMITGANTGIEEKATFKEKKQPAVK
jgi:hypothetical protein